MKRRHSRKDAVDLCARLRAARPEFTFGADIIAGFPTETDAMFENSRRIISEISIPWLHVFPFSPREGTPAAKIVPVNGNIVKARAKTLREAGAAEKARHLQTRIGQNDEALFEETGLGRLPDFSMVKVDNLPLDIKKTAGSLRQIRILDATAEHLIGQVIG
jgi:threonylcarbamoyladenosine tRNA methylthiotransferase MtaB